MLRLVLLLALLVPAYPAEAAGAECLPATPTNPDGNYIVPGTHGGIVYRAAGDARLKLDVWAPRDSTRRPVVVVVHGGGLTSGSRIAFVGQFLEMLTDAGYAWASIDYRLGGAAGFDAAVEDVAAAVAFVRCRASELHVDPARVLLLGEDSGADLVAAVLARRPPGVQGAVLVGGRYEITPANRAAPAAGVGAMLVVHGGGDREVPLERARGVCDDWRAADGRCDLRIVDGASHRAENWWPSQWDYKHDVVRFLCDTAPVPECRSAASGQAAVRDAQPSPASPRALARGLHRRVPFGAGLTLNAWLPSPGAGGAPALILVHGGGWEAGDRVTYITPLFEPLAQAGFAWFSVDYRLTPDVRHEAQLQDVRAAVQHVRDNAARYGVDPKRLVLVGESASGQMAALLGTERDLRLSGVVSFYGVYDFLPMVTDAAPRSLLVRLFGPRPLDDDARELLKRFSPLHQAHRGMAPVLLIHGTNERLWDQGTSMAARLEALGVEHALVRLDGAPHGMENWEGRPEWLGYKTRLVEWLRRRFGAR